MAGRTVTRMVAPAAMSIDIADAADDDELADAADGV